MKRVTLTAADRRTIKQFRKIVSKPAYTREELSTWQATVTNPAICKGELSYRDRNPNLLDGRKLSGILQPIYGEARTIAEQRTKARIARKKVEPIKKVEAVKPLNEEEKKRTWEGVQNLIKILNENR